jgi:hypothetical protein
MYRWMLALLTVLVFVLPASTQNGTNHPVVWNCCRTTGTPVVPNQAVAIALAKDVLVPVTGKEMVNSQEPFTATLQDGIWIVSGTFTSSQPKDSTPLPPGSVRGGTLDGGQLQVRLLEENARVASCCLAVSPFWPSPR